MKAPDSFILCVMHLTVSGWLFISDLQPVFLQSWRKWRSSVELPSPKKKKHCLASRLIDVKYKKQNFLCGLFRDVWEKQNQNLSPKWLNLFIYLFIIHVAYYLPSSTESVYLNKHIIFKIMLLKLSPKFRIYKGLVSHEGNILTLQWHSSTFLQVSNEHSRQNISVDPSKYNSSLLIPWHKQALYS